MFAHFATTSFRQSIKPQAILCQVYLSQKPPFKLFKLHEIDLAFEHRLLHPLAGTFANLGYAPQPPATFPGFSVHVVAGDHQHIFTSR